MDCNTSHTKLSLRRLDYPLFNVLPTKVSFLVVRMISLTFKDIYKWLELISYRIWNQPTSSNTWDPWLFWVHANPSSSWPHENDQSFLEVETNLDFFQLILALAHYWNMVRDILVHSKFQSKCDKVLCCMYNIDISKWHPMRFLNQCCVVFFSKENIWSLFWNYKISKFFECGFKLNSFNF